MKNHFTQAILCGLMFILFSCSDSDRKKGLAPSTNENIFTNTDAALSTDNYQNQTTPAYIIKDNTTPNNRITNQGAALGRVLFYDKNLSVNNTIACASCHQQAHAFGDPRQASVGVNGNSARHSMRLVNAGFSRERRFFWDERANTLETQTTMPIQDHIEMGFSGTSGDPNLASLIEKLSSLEYYPSLFTAAYGNANITEAKIQNALAQFIRSIQSFDSKYDIGRAAAGNNNANFSNFTAQENRGKALFMGNRAKCNNCHEAPEFSIDPNSKNNGLITTISGIGTDTQVTKSPTLRDLINPNGSLNALAMHDGSITTAEAILQHYRNGVTNNNNLDQRIRGGINLNQNERADLVAFLKTLTGKDVYTNVKWSDPFVKKYKAKNMNQVLQI